MATVGLNSWYSTVFGSSLGGVTLVPNILFGSQAVNSTVSDINTHKFFFTTLNASLAFNGLLLIRLSPRDGPHAVKLSVRQSAEWGFTKSHEFAGS